MRKVLLTLLLLLSFVSVAKAQIFNCTTFTTTPGPCGIFNSSFNAVGNVTPTIDSTGLNLFPSGSGHMVEGLIYQTPVNTNSFASSFTFIPNGLYLSFVFNNTTNVPGYQGKSFQGGAGCEGDFFQGFGGTAPPNNVFAVNFDGYDPLNPNQTAPYDFVYSSVQMYQSNLSTAVYPNIYIQCPCIGGSNICGNNTSPLDGLYQITKLSTSPVPLNNPPTAVETTTGDTYSATLNYDGSNLKLNLFDVTKGGACPGSTCFTKTWTGVNIPNSVGGNTAWVMLGASSASASSYPLYIKSFTYGPDGPNEAPTASPTVTATPTPVPTATPVGGNCSFTSPSGTATWNCSQGAKLSSSTIQEESEHVVWAPGKPWVPPGQMMARHPEPMPMMPNNQARPSAVPTSAPPSVGNCTFTSPEGAASWSCQ